ncbi:uncharacterized protein LOC135033561 [Pseudophryne corroboree]|uniref:uncharacterized protein LOC135033561 n=1 Tax=Pseudophryne corroboree TaxID=495146 RepID=UPI003081CCAC
MPRLHPSSQGADTLEGPSGTLPPLPVTGLQAYLGTLRPPAPTSTTTTTTTTATTPPSSIPGTSIMTGLQADQGPPCPPGPATICPPILHWRGKHSPPHIQQEEAGPSSPSGPSMDSYECWSSPEPLEPTVYYESFSSDEEVTAALPPVCTRPLPGLHSPILPEEESKDGEWPETPPLPYCGEEPGHHHLEQLP